MPKISVIVPAVNESKYIKNLLEALKAQSFRDFEIIVADGGSRDNTREIARRYGKVVVDRHRGIGLGRNVGARAARGEILVFLDADTRPDRGLLAAWDRAFGGDMVAGTGPILPLEKGGLLMDLGFRFVSVFFIRLALLLGQPSIIGSNFAVRRKAFWKAGGFDEKLITYEDWDLSARLAKLGRIAYVDDAVVRASIRRVKKWGMLNYALYHMANVVRYNVLKKPSTDYEPVR